MNILHVTTFLQGGAGRIIADLACSQAHSGNSVTVTVSGNGAPGYGNYPELLERLQAAGVNLIFVESTFKRDVALNVAAFSHIAGALENVPPSLIHTHAAIPTLVALLLRSRLRYPVPILQTMHGWGIHKTPEQQATDIALMNCTDRLIAPSESSRCLLIRAGVKSDILEVIPNGSAPITVPQDRHRTEPLREWRASGHTVLICLGTVCSRKDQRLLITAMAHPMAPRKIACAFVGEGEDIRELEVLGNERGLGERVRFFGYQPRGAEFLEAADWLILPSKDEGLPISVLEAYSASVPVLGSDIPEIAEIIENGRTGLLFRAGDPESLTAALRTIAAIPDYQRCQMGLQARQIWQNRYSLESMLSRYGNVYRNLL